MTEVSHGGDWFVNEFYAGPRSFSTPAEWEGFVGHYRNDSPWLTSLRIVRRKDKLWLEGSGGNDMQLAPINGICFELWIRRSIRNGFQFLDLVDDRAMHLKVLGRGLLAGGCVLNSW
jgi:hypothetical protein